MSALLQDWVRETARRSPDARAVIGEDATVTYREVHEYANRLAHTLRAHGCERGDRVAVLLPRSARAVASLIGILEAGCAYVPLDSGSGVNRSADIVRQCEPEIILAQDGQAELLTALRDTGALNRTRIGWLGTDESRPEEAAFGRREVRSAASASPERIGEPDDLAYIMFTSGTTGSPKGVPITHANVRPFIEWVVETFELGPDDRISGHTALTFDLSTFDIYATFAAGAELHQVPKRVRLHPRGVADFVGDRGLTLWFSVPSQLAYVEKFDALDGRTLPSLRHVAWCGDVLTASTLLYWKRHLPGVHFTNLYGPTETTVASSAFRVPHDFSDPAADIPIGTGCRGEELLVLDDHLEPTEVGEIGDLFIRGVGLSPGYWRDQEKTDEAFIADPNPTNGDGRLYRTGDLARRDADGIVHFLGRADFQIKTSGYRVEPAEVENAVLLLEEIESCVVVPVELDDFSGSGIGCAYVPSNGAPLRTSKAKARLAERLPGYMIPKRWLLLDELPLDGRGKVDRARTRAMLGG